MKLTPEQKKVWIDAALAFVEGEPIEYQTPDGKWKDADMIDTDCPHRRKPKPASPYMVPLEAEDLIGCMLRPPVATSGWIAIEGTSEVLVYIPPRGCYERSIPFAKLQADGWTYHRPGDCDADGKPVWRRCEKKAK